MAENDNAPKGPPTGNAPKGPPTGNWRKSLPDGLRMMRLRRKLGGKDGTDVVFSRRVPNELDGWAGVMAYADEVTYAAGHKEKDSPEQYGVQTVIGAIQSLEGNIHALLSLTPSQGQNGDIYLPPIVSVREVDTTAVVSSRVSEILAAKAAAGEPLTLDANDLGEINAIFASLTS